MTVDAGRMLDILESPDLFCEWVSGEAQASCHRKMQRAATLYDRMVMWAPPEFGKSRQITFRRLAWEIVGNPNIRCGIVGAKDQQAQDLLKGCKQVVSKAVKMGCSILTSIQQARNDRLMMVRTITQPEPTVQCIGIGGSFIGARLDLIIIDDAIQFGDSWSAADRERHYRWIISSMCLGRLLPGGRIWILGNTWHPEDAMHRLSNDHAFRPVRIYAADDPVSLHGPTWPEQFPTERLKQKRIDLGSMEFARQYFHEAINTENQRFRSEWIDAAFCAGDDYTLLHAYRAPAIIAGVDYGIGQNKSHDKSAIVILAREGDRKRLVWAESGRWDSPTMRDKLKNLQARYPGLVIRVEHAGQQALLTPMLKEAGINVTPHSTTAASKHHSVWGVEALAAKLESGQYIFPGKSRDAPAVQALVRAMLYWTPADHLPDELAAFWIADCGFAMSGSRSQATPKPNVDYAL